MTTRPERDAAWEAEMSRQLKIGGRLSRRKIRALIEELRHPERHVQYPLTTPKP